MVLNSETIILNHELLIFNEIFINLCFYDFINYLFVVNFVQVLLLI